eukprot:scaffold942_cov260-Pinguiococcus_pyrenoidosus.AAC.18
MTRTRKSAKPHARTRTQRRLAGEAVSEIAPEEPRADRLRKARGEKPHRAKAARALLPYETRGETLADLDETSTSSRSLSPTAAPPSTSASSATRERRERRSLALEEDSPIISVEDDDAPQQSSPEPRCPVSQRSSCPESCNRAGDTRKASSASNRQPAIDWSGSVEDAQHVELSAGEAAWLEAVDNTTFQRAHKLLAEKVKAYALVVRDRESAAKVSMNEERCRSRTREHCSEAVKALKAKRALADDLLRSNLIGQEAYEGKIKELEEEAKKVFQDLGSQQPTGSGSK